MLTDIVLFILYLPMFILESSLIIGLPIKDRTMAIARHPKRKRKYQMP